MKIDLETKELLLSEAARINSPAFVMDDPVQFPRRFSDKRDAEISGFLVAHIAWGKRKMILRDAEKLLGLMDGEPYGFIREGDFSGIPDDMNIHRTFFGRNLKHMLRGMKRVYDHHHSLDDFCRSIGADRSEEPAWVFAEALRHEFCEANGGKECPRGIPGNMRTTALKRINMWLRWMVRDDGIVDLGMWDSLKPSQLYIPLDVHVGNTSRALGLLERKGNDRKAVEELTGSLREIKPDDPVLLDFALFGIGVEGNTLVVD